MIFPFKPKSGRKDKKTYIALYNQGGGMRGLIPAHIMTHIETQTGLRMADMVDIFAGPSTASILNAALVRPSRHHRNRPMFRARNLVRFYESNGLKIFPPDRFRSFRGIIHDFNNRTLRLGQLNAIMRHGHYDPKNLKFALKKLLGNTSLQDTLSSIVIPSYNIDRDQLAIARENDEGDQSPAPTKNNFMDQGGHAIWFKNIITEHGLLPTKKPIPDVLLYDAVMSSCAAPTFFPCYHMTMPRENGAGLQNYAMIDGQIFDNACISYLGAIRRHIPKDGDLIMIVLGTGYTNYSIKGEDWNRYGSLGIVDPVNDFPLINIFFHASESALMDSFEEEIGDNLFLFNKSMRAFTEAQQETLPSQQIDDASPENLKKLQQFADAIVYDNKAQFDMMCDILVKNHNANQ